MGNLAEQPGIGALLESRLKGVVVIAGIGNPLRGDDGAGPRFLSILKKRLENLAVRPSVHLMNCRETPENYFRPIARLRPDTVILVDCASLGLAPGQLRIVEAGDLCEHNPSTHGISPALFMNRLKQETAADVFMIAVQPATTSFREPLSQPVTRALTELASLVEGVMGRT
jgi:hydrogenase 3 maturation protease